MFTVLNEPNVWLSAAYLRGVVPPGVQSVRKLFDAGVQLLRAHAAAARRIRLAVPGARIGVAHNVVRFAPDRPEHPVDRVAAYYADLSFNHALPRALGSVIGKQSLGLFEGFAVLVGEALHVLQISHRHSFLPDVSPAACGWWCVVSESKARIVVHACRFSMNIVYAFFALRSKNC